MDFKNRIILAPMVPVNNIAFRRLCTDCGADIVYSQMIDSRAMVMGNSRMADFYDEKNLVAQFFGNDPDSIAECAKEIEGKVQGVDLNLGCPHSNVVKRECGSYLMRYPERVRKIIRKLVKSVNAPVTAKIRAGYDRNNINAVEIAKLCEKEGASAVAVHGRARTINYEHPVDYSIIKEVKDSLDIPVIGNGDIFNGKDAKMMFDRTGCDSVMVARGAIGNPFVFSEIKDYIKGKKKKAVDRKRIFSSFFRYCRKYGIELRDIKMHAQWLTKGMKHGAQYRKRMNDARSTEDIEAIFEGISWK